MRVAGSSVRVGHGECWLEKMVGSAEVLIAASWASQRRLRVPPSVPSDFPQECWQQLDEVDLSGVFLQRTPMLKSCPRFLRGQLRFSFGLALRERCRAKLNRDLVAELRGVEIVRARSQCVAP